MIPEFDSESSSDSDLAVSGWQAPPSEPAAQIGVEPHVLDPAFSV